jgi:cation diffusion facilitator CzcD-associated flavoprotein CzcO
VNAMIRKMTRGYIDQEFADRPELRNAVTPKYWYPRRRLVFTTTFIPALKRENVELVARSVEKVASRGLVDVGGVEREIDVPVVCTGFKVAECRPRLRVVGRGGIELHDTWKR